MSVDLHVHSTASDGTLSPAEVVRDAVAAGLSAAALADHDTFAGIPEALAEARVHGFTLIPTVEVSAQQGALELHILGFLADPREPGLQKALSDVRDAREDRTHKIVAKLASVGATISMDNVREVAGDAALGRPHIAAALVRAGAVNSSQEAFTRYLRRGRPAYVDRYRLPVADALQLIRGAGGLPVLAHPGLGCPDGVIEALVQQGLLGLEAYHVDHRPRQVRHYLELSDRLGLMVTGGSDSHGPAGPTPVKVGAVDVPDQCALDLIAWGERNGRWPPDPAVYSAELCLKGQSE